MFSGYIVEKQEEGSSYWDKVPGIVNGTTHKVPNLTEGKKYKFRVKAENIYGVGEPLETDKPVLAKNPFGKYHESPKCWDMQKIAVIALKPESDLPLKDADGKANSASPD